MYLGVQIQPGNPEPYDVNAAEIQVLDSKKNAPVSDIPQESG